MREKALGILFFLFIACFVAIVIEEMFIGGRRRRQAAKKARQLRDAGGTAEK